MTDRNPLTKIADDIYQLRLPLPFALNHVNVYLLRAAAGWTIVDCGINWEKGRVVWENAFNELNITGADIEKIILTHVHPDHFGLAGWLQAFAKSAGNNIDIFTSPREDQQMHDVWKGERLDFSEWLRVNGMPDAMALDVDHSMDDTSQMTLPHPPMLKHIAEDATIRLGERDFQTIIAPGHSDGQLIFYDAADQLLLSGDHVLMRITPNIGLWENTDPNPLGAYIQSLRSLSDLDVRLALPGHRRNIEDWSGRIAEILGHHEERLATVIDALEQGSRSPYAVANYIFETGRFSPHEWRFAIAETLSHLEYLRVEGKIEQDENEQIFSV